MLGVAADNLAVAVDSRAAVAADSRAAVIVAADSRAAVIVAADSLAVENNFEYRTQLRSLDKHFLDTQSHSFDISYCFLPF